MTQALLDQHTHLDSFLHRLDPRAKLASFLLAIAIIASTPAGAWHAFPFYYLAIWLLVTASRVPFLYFVVRAALVSPFLLMAAGLPLFSAVLEAWANGLDWPERAVEEAALERGTLALLKGYGAIFLLVLLSATTRFHHLLWGLRRIRIPEIVSLIATMMYNHIFLLADEWHRTTRARLSRAPQLRKGLRWSTYSKQIAIIFVRSWERADRVHAAMLARGFTGELPVLDAGRFTISDAAFTAIALACFLLIRLAGA